VRGDVYAACLGLKEGGLGRRARGRRGATSGLALGGRARKGPGGPKEDDEAGLFDAVIIDEAAQVRELLTPPSTSRLPCLHPYPCDMR